MTVREELQEQKSKIRKIEAELDQAEFLKQFLPESKKLVGSTWVYRRNSYSCPEKDSDYWDMFRKVLAIVPDVESCGVHLIFEEVQIDSRGTASIKTDSEWTNGQSVGFRSGGFHRCGPSIYKRAKAVTLREMAKLSVIKSRILDR